MKKIKHLIPLLLMLASNAVTNAQHHHGGSPPPVMNMNNNSNLALPARTENLKVWGKCVMCKERIEKIALEAGAESAEWDIKAKFLKVVYGPGSSSLGYISDKLAKAGHDTGLSSAKDKAYFKLPECCQYERQR